jgi:anti-sigma factor RsiW
MDCRDIQKRLSAYLDGLLSTDEKETVDTHLSSCSHCGLFFEELQRARRLLRDLGDVEPPPWLSQKIMTRVREEAEQKESFWKQLCYPFPLRLSAQALGVLVIAVLAFQVYRTIAPEIVMTPQLVPAPQVEKSLRKEEAATPAPARETAVSPDRREQEEVAATKDKGIARDRELRQTAPAGVSAGKKPQVPQHATPETNAEKKSFAAAALNQPQSAVVPGKPDKEGLGAFGKEEDVQVHAPAPSGTVAAGVAQEALPSIVVLSGDIPAARKEVGKIVAALGGKTIETSEQERGAVIIVEVAAVHFGALSESVGKLGELKSTPQISALAEGPLRLRIEILPK